MFLTHRFPSDSLNGLYLHNILTGCCIHTPAGTVWTATAHIITAVIGSGVLSLAWGVAQLGWVGGPAAIVLFGAVICYTSTLLAECYRSGDPVFGPRNRTYIDAVRATLGDFKERLCGAIQLSNLFGIGIGVSIAASVSMQ